MSRAECKGTSPTPLGHFNNPRPFVIFVVPPRHGTSRTELLRPAICTLSKAGFRTSSPNKRDGIKNSVTVERNWPAERSRGSEDRGPPRDFTWLAAGASVGAAGAPRSSLRSPRRDPQVFPDSGAAVLPSQKSFSIFCIFVVMSVSKHFSSSSATGEMKYGGSQQTETFPWDEVSATSRSGSVPPKGEGFGESLDQRHRVYCLYFAENAFC